MGKQSSSFIFNCLNQQADQHKNKIQKKKNPEIWKPGWFETRGSREFESLISITNQRQAILSIHPSYSFFFFSKSLSRKRKSPILHPLIDSFVFGSNRLIEKRKRPKRKSYGSSRRQIGRCRGSHGCWSWEAPHFHCPHRHR